MHTKLKERFRYKVKPGKKKYWVALISEDLYNDGYLLLPVRPLDEVVDEFSRFYMYVFKTKDDADTFGLWYHQTNYFYKFLFFVPKKFLIVHLFFL